MELILPEDQRHIDNADALLLEGEPIEDVGIYCYMESMIAKEMLTGLIIPPEAAILQIQRHACTSIRQRNMEITQSLQVFVKLSNGRAT